MVLLLAMLLQAAEAPPSADPVVTYQALTSVEPRCKTGPEGRDILVCARRGADRYRVPFLVPTPGDPKGLMPKQETAKLLYRPTPCEENGPFLIGCGVAGVTVSTNLGTGKVELRELAP